MFSLRTTCIAILLSATCAAHLTAQVAIDVKTPIARKGKIAVVKQGVSSALKASGWARTTEFGEDYALYLHDLQRQKGSLDTVVVRLLIEVRKPSFLKKGDLIATETVEVRYSVGALDSVVEGLGTEVGMSEYRAASAIVTQVVAIAAEVIPFPHPLLKTLLVGVAGSLNREPTDGEIFEAVLLGVRSADAVAKILENV